tara:strand:- start:14 stop:595 length:582 start_codon:yes stop_codon:yes gene_type:complete
MEIEKILEEIGESYFPLSVECRRDFIQHIKVRHFKKGDIVVREGQYSKKAYLITKGCARAYYLKDGKDITDWFTFENQFMASIISFFSEKPSPHIVEFLEESIALEFSKLTVDRLADKHHDFERFISKVVTETMLGLCERLHTIQFSKADERYKNLTAIYPGISQRIPLTHLASYLGITLETLSRIRNPKVRI